MNVGRCKPTYDWINAFLEMFDGQENERLRKNVVVGRFPNDTEADDWFIWLNFRPEGFDYTAYFDSVASIADAEDRRSMFYIGRGDDFRGDLPAPESEEEEVEEVLDLMAYCDAKIAEFLLEHPIEGVFRTTPLGEREEDRK